MNYSFRTFCTDTGRYRAQELFHFTITSISTHYNRANLSMTRFITGFRRLVLDSRFTYLNTKSLDLGVYTQGLLHCWRWNKKKA